MSAALLTIIGARNLRLTDRMDAAVAMDILDFWAAEQIREEKVFIRDLLRALVDEAACARHACKETAALEVNRRIDRARVHLDAPTVDFRAVQEHLEAAIAAIEGSR